MTDPLFEMTEDELFNRLTTAGIARRQDLVVEERGGEWKAELRGPPVPLSVDGRDRLDAMRNLAIMLDTAAGTG